MSLYRSNARGSWFVQRRLLGIQIRRATGIYDWERAQEFERVLVNLARHGRRDLLTAFDTGEIGGPELAAAVEEFGISYQLSAGRAILLAPAIKRWLETADIVASTRQSYRNGLKALQRGARQPRVADLPKLLARYARRTPPVQFQRVQAAAQSFVTATVPKGQHSDLWRDVAAIQGARVAPRKVQKGLPPEKARAVAEALAARFGATAAQMWWTLCLTGMGRKEYWKRKRDPASGRWEVRDDRILVHGTKRGHRDRVIFRTVTPVRATIPEKSFAEMLKDVGGGLGVANLTIYVARRTFSHVLELAKILDSRCDAYMGHSPKGVRGLYREHDVEPYLAGDAAAFRAALGKDPQYMRAMA